TSASVRPSVSTKLMSPTSGGARPKRTHNSLTSSSGSVARGRSIVLQTTTHPLPCRIRDRREGPDRQCEQQARHDERRTLLEDGLAPVREHVSPARRRRRHAEPEETQC